MDPEQGIQLALLEAKEALKRGEVPVGCILVNEAGKIIAKGSNQTNELGDATAHAEMIAFKQLGMKEIKKKSLTLYVTCEPCIMCASAIVQTQLFKHIVFGCSNPRFGGCGSVRSLDMYMKEYELPQVTRDICTKEGIELLSQFYTRSNPNAPRPKKKRKKKVTETEEVDKE